MGKQQGAKRVKIEGEAAPTKRLSARQSAEAMRLSVEIDHLLADMPRRIAAMNQELDEILARSRARRAG